MVQGLSVAKVPGVSGLLAWLLLQMYPGCMLCTLAGLVQSEGVKFLLEVLGLPVLSLVSAGSTVNIHYVSNTSLRRFYNFLQYFCSSPDLPGTFYPVLVAKDHLHVRRY